MSARRLFSIALLVIALAGLALRVAAVVDDNALYSPTGYDDGVYFSASALLVRGVLPYRDFAFVHPPALLYVLATTSWLDDPRDGFAAARMLAAVIGAINIALLGIIVARASSPAGGLVAALLYAAYPDAVVAERSPYLEPVLNLFCLISAGFWLRRRAAGAGIAAGIACAVKFWAGIWVIAAIAATSRKQMRDALVFIGSAAVAGAIALAPLALTAPKAFVAQTLLFQFGRPVDGVVDRMARLRDIAGSGHRAATVLAIVALVVFLVQIVRRRGITSAQRYFGVAMLLTVAAFLASSSYWNHYNSHLAASQCAVAGLGAAALLQALPRHRGIGIVAVFALIAVLDFGVWRVMVRHTRAQTAELLTVAHTVPKVVPHDASFFAFDPTWSIISGRLPDCCDGAPPMVDSYGAMLLSAVQRGGRHASTGSAFRSGAPQPELRARLARSQYVLLGWRGHWQLDEPDRAWFSSRFRCATPEAEDLCIWQRRERLVLPVPLESQLIRFEDGWYGREGVPPSTWRWMSARSKTTLPPIDVRARLELELEVPLTSLPKPPAISIRINDREIDRFVAREPKITRAYDLDLPGNAPHTLAIISDQYFVPERLGVSGDTRALALNLTRIAWRPASGAAMSLHK